MISILWKNFEGLINEDNNCDVHSITNERFFDDLKIRRVLETTYDSYSESDEVIDVLKRIPNLETIYYRQEFLEDIFNSNEEIEKIYYELLDIVSRKEAIENAQEKIRRRFLLVFYNYNLHNFFSRVVNYLQDNNYKSCCAKKLIDTINNYLDNNKELIQDTDKLYHELINILKMNIEYHDGAPYVTLENVLKDNLEDDLLNICKDLNIEIFDSYKKQNRKEINAYYILEIINGHEKLKEKLIQYYDTNINDVINLNKYIKELRFYCLIKLLFNELSKNIHMCKCTFNDEFTTLSSSYDISLVSSKINTIPNDFVISDSENIQFILGVNSGGKTCYIRSVGINYLLANTVGYAFCKEANVLALKYFNSHFPNEENYKVGDGRLIDEINRLKEIKKTFSKYSITFLNETFSSTSEDKACVLTYDLIEKCTNTKSKILFVTHQYKIFDEVKNQNIGYYTPVVEEGNTNIRTYKIKKVEQKLLSYVNDILVKHGLTKEMLRGRKK